MMCVAWWLLISTGLVTSAKLFLLVFYPDCLTPIVSDSDIWLATAQGNKH